MSSGAPGAIVGGEGHRSFSADELARAVGGRLIGDGAVAVRAIAPLDRAEHSELSFLASPRYAALFARTRAGVVLVTPELADAPGAPSARIVVERPHDALVGLIPHFYASPPRAAGVHPSARLGRGVRLGRDVCVGPYVVVEDGAALGDRAWVDAHCVIGAGVEAGDDVRLHPGVTLYSGTRLGNRVIVHAGAQLGSDGFGYVFRGGAHERIPHVGRCVVEDDVEVGANTTIDRGSIDDTVIGAGTKIDNLVHVGHNVRVGRLCLLLAQVGIAGSAHIEDGVILAGQVGVGGHVTIGRGARVAGQAGVFGDVPAGESWSGYPARPHREALRAQAALFRLAGLMRKLERLLAREDA